MHTGGVPVRKLFVLPFLSLVSSVLTAQGKLASAPACPSMEVSSVTDKSAQSPRQILSPAGETLWLTQKPLLNMSDFTGANVTLTEGQIVLNVNLTPESAKRIQEFSTNHVGTKLAFLIDGHVINTPTILDPIKGNGILIAPFTREEAQKLADSINQKNGHCKVPATK